MISAFIFVFKRFAWFKRLNAKITYELLAKYIPAADWHFMNYGYCPEPHEVNSQLLAVDTNQKYSLQMYHYLASKTCVEGKNLLEVGSGRGGGARHIAGTFRPSSYIGMDIAPSAVALANKIHPAPNLKFIQGSAESIPLTNESMDVVINVESCHAYGSVEKFLSEVKRVLKPGGYFLMVDFRNVPNMEILRSQLHSTGMKILEDQNISDNVVKAMEAEDAAKRERIQKLIPSRWQKLFAEFAGVAGSRIHMNLKNRSRLYYRFVLQKA